MGTIVNVLFLTDSQDRDIGHYMPFDLIAEMHKLMNRDYSGDLGQPRSDGIWLVSCDSRLNLNIMDYENNKIRIAIRYVEPRRIDGDQLVGMLKKGEVTYEQLLGEIGLTKADFDERTIVVDTCYSGKPMVQYTVGHYAREAAMPVYLVHEAFLLGRNEAIESVAKETAISAQYISQNDYFGRLSIQAAKDRRDSFWRVGQSFLRFFNDDTSVAERALTSILLTASAMLITEPKNLT